MNFLMSIYGLLRECKLTSGPRHEISNNVVCATSKGSDQHAHTLEYFMTVKLLTEQHLEFLS